MISIIVGGQYGSEGKGKVAHYFAWKKNAKVAVRVGGTNSGHTVVDNSSKHRIFRMLPTASIINTIECVLPAGSYIDLDILLDEIDSVGLDHERLIIDPNAVVIANRYKEQESKSNLGEIGSTLSGTGAAVAARVKRTGDILLAKHEPLLEKYIVNTKKYLREQLQNGNHIIVEGTQGYGLSVLHSEFYPHATSRDTTAAGFLSEVGLSPFDVEDIVLVIRAFPIRVSGKSGPLTNEIDWDTLTRESKSNDPIIEYTSATKRIRRVARFDSDIVKDAIIANNPNTIVLNHLDYVDSECYEKDTLTEKVSDFIDSIEKLIDKKINLVGTGPSVLNSFEDISICSIKTKQHTQCLSPYFAGRAN